MQNNQNLVGIEISITSLKAVVLTRDGKLVRSEIVELRRNEETLPQLIGFINKLKSSEETIRKVGIAVPGLVNHITKRVAYSSQFPEQAEVDFIDQIQKETGIDAVVENDANAAALGEYELGAGRGSKDMFYVTLGAGVGGALIFNGEIWRGTSGFAGEFGYITINSEGMKLEEVASASNIIRRIRNRFHQDPTSSLNEIGEENFTIVDVVNEAGKGDGFAQMMLERTGAYVGTGVASVINLLNIERIVVGGDVMDSEDYVLNAMIERARELSFTPAFETTKILASELQKNAAAIGAALLTR